MDETAYIETLAGDLKLVMEDFTPQESRRFETAWKTVVNYYSINDTQIFEGGTKDSLLKIARAFKRKAKLPFEGPLSQSGFGMRPIIIYDVTGTRITTNEWDVSLTTAGIRSWLFNHTAAVGNAPIGGATASDAFGGHEKLLPVDSSGDRWRIVLLGIGTFSSSPKVRGVRLEHAGVTLGDIPVDNQLRNSEDGMADFKGILDIDVENTYAVGADIRTTGSDSLYPVGVVFATASRLQKLGSAIPNRCV